MSVLIPVLSRTPNLLPELVKALPSVKFHKVTDPEVDIHFKKSEILICDFDLLGPYLYDLPSVKWVQGTWAGIDKLTPLIQKEKQLPYQITRFTGEHFGRIMSEYVVANIVNHERNFFQVRSNQDKQEWNRHGKITGYRVISDLTTGILGLGNIGSRIGKTLYALGATVLAFGRRPALPDGNEYSHVSKYYTKETLPLFLKECDYIINVLPKTDETDGILDNDVLENSAEKKSVLINIGRSNVISEESIIRALDNNWISAAIIDVYDVEPLPQNNPLWQMKQVFLTPHVAGMSRAKDIADQFQKNLDLYNKKVPLPGLIDFNRGY
ncbi:glyoxylate/hydroxypyruvate reductase A-like [Zophobas morio]|uniref:glyoxylate/hydroxypyruvate reductase A-like n=1 Tax=Zophobas morio TaxID=2755281 RepID=UPI003083DA4F